MANHVCFIVPPYLLEGIAQSPDTGAREVAAKTISLSHKLRDDRLQHFAASSAPGSRPQDAPSTSQARSIVPDYLLEHISKAEDVDEEVKKSATQSLALSQQIRDGRQQTLAEHPQHAVSKTVAHFWRGVYNMENQGSEDDDGQSLPGEPARLEGQPASSDQTVNQAYDSCLKVLQFYKDTFNYDSIDNKNMHVINSVHFGSGFGNAFWNGQQMVYGDGDDTIGNFTACLDVIGHEMTHGVTQFNSKLEYEGESGALNEHISDVFGIMVKQIVEQTTAEQSDWLIGEGCLMPGVKGVALRNMQSPGTAYNDPKLGGKDPQPASYDEIPAWVTQDEPSRNNDFGGVHLTSGIPNRAFAISALAFGGFSWEKAGKIWWKTVTSRQISPHCTFIQFADLTVESAKKLYGVSDARTVRNAWNTVGVVRHI